jgi:hypothetical protein
MSVLEYLKNQQCVTASLVSGPNGQFISGVKKDGTSVTLPVGKKSFNQPLSEYNILTTDDGAVIATANAYETVESVAL